MFDCIIETIEPERFVRYQLTKAAAPLTYAQALNLLQFDQSFRTYLTSLLAKAPFSAYQWETPAIAANSTTRQFEFTLFNSPEFTERATDRETFTAYFTADDTDQGVVAFSNLGGDATLIVPSPRSADDAYGHIAAFIRNAPAAQVDALWRVIGTTVANQVSASPLWLSTSGEAVAWLHVRLDSRPKYYHFAPYRRSETMQPEFV